MAEIVNLRMARKARNRREAEQQAAQNRAKYGRTKAEKARDNAEAERLNRTVEGARREEHESDQAGSPSASTHGTIETTRRHSRNKQDSNVQQSAHRSRFPLSRE